MITEDFSTASEDDRRFPTASKYSRRFSRTSEPCRNTGLCQEFKYEWQNRINSLICWSIFCQNWILNFHLMGLWATNSYLSVRREILDCTREIDILDPQAWDSRIMHETWQVYYLYKITFFYCFCLYSLRSVNIKKEDKRCKLKIRPYWKVRKLKIIIFFSTYSSLVLWTTVPYPDYKNPSSCSFDIFL